MHRQIEHRKCLWKMPQHVSASHTHRLVGPVMSVSINLRLCGEGFVPDAFVDP